MSNTGDLEMWQTGRSRPATSCTDPERASVSVSILSPESGSGEIKRPLARCASP